MGKKDVSNSCSLNTSPPSRRSWTRRSLLWPAIFASTVCALAAPMPACGPGVRHMSVSHPTVRASGETEMTHDGLTVRVEPITWETASQFREVVPMFTIRTPRRVITTPGNVVPLPAFRITLTNHTGHVVRFTQSVIRLTDNLSRPYQAFATTGELLAWAQSAWAPVTAIDPSIDGELSRTIGRLQIFSRNTELLDGDSTPFYLVFNLPVSSDAEHRAFLESVSRLTLRLAEVPVEIGDAGQVTRTTEFEFTFDRAEYPQPATCPGSGEPSWTICQME